MNKRLKEGIRIESEHKGTVKFIQAYSKRTGKIPSNKKIFEKIAEDHLNEDKNYYTKLKKCNL